MNDFLSDTRSRVAFWKPIHFLKPLFTLTLSTFQRQNEMVSGWWNQLLTILSIRLPFDLKAKFYVFIIIN